MRREGSARARGYIGECGGHPSCEDRGVLGLQLVITLLMPANKERVPVLFDVRLECNCWSGDFHPLYHATLSKVKRYQWLCMIYALS